jgi:NADH-quinone oxidoreductase subunit E
LEPAESHRLVVDRVFEKYRDQNPLQSALIPVLQGVQSELGYIPEQALDRVSLLLGLPTSHVYGVATFYHQFRLVPRGRHMITVCRGTACHVKGSLEVNELIMNELGITEKSDTSKDGVFTLQQVRCVGACGLAPVIKVDDEFYGNVDPAKVRRILGKYREQGGASAQ